MSSNVASNCATYAASQHSDMLLEQEVKIPKHTREATSDVSLDEIAEAAASFAASLKVAGANTHLDTLLDFFIANTCDSQMPFDPSSDKMNVEEHIQKAKLLIENFDAIFGREEVSIHGKN